MKLESLLQNIDTRWRPDFVSFVQTGDASPAFLSYLDGDIRAQAAVEQVFTAQAEALEGLAKLVKTSDLGTSVRATPAEGATIAHSFERIAELPEDEMEQAMSVAATTLARHVGVKPERASTVMSALSTLQNKIGTMIK